jgi:hypothetical protein
MRPRYILHYESRFGPAALEIPHPSSLSNELRKHLRSSGTSFELHRESKELDAVLVEVIEKFPHQKHKDIIAELRGEVEEIV